MKNAIKWFGNLNRDRRSKVPLLIIVLVAVIGFSMAACDNSGGGGIRPEDMPVKDRWWSFVDSTSTATLDYSVDDDGVCIITVDGTAQPNDETDNWGRWKAMAGFSYTGNKGKSYVYKFEAWTGSDTRDLNVEYYEDNNNYVYLIETVQITTTPQTYTIYGEFLPGSTDAVRFPCADQTGTFYVKILEIKEYTPGKLTITNFSGILNQNDYIFVYEGKYHDDYGTLVFDRDGGRIQIKGNTITIPVWEVVYSEEDVTFVPFLGNITIDAGNLGLYQSDENWVQLGSYSNKVPITFTNGNATINFKTQMEEKEMGGGEEKANTVPHIKISTIMKIMME